MKNAEQQKNFDRLPEIMKHRVEQGKRLTKCEMGLSFPAFSFQSIYWDSIGRDRLVTDFNNRFGTTVK